MQHRDEIKPAMGVAIEARDLRKKFSGKGGTVQALKSVSFTANREQVLAILGPNGAGKTTLLRILTTVMRPSSGHGYVEGFEIGRQNIQIRQLIGIVAQENHFDRYLTVWQNLTLHAQMHGLEKPFYEKRIQQLLEKVELYDRRHDYMENFSGGMQRRVALIRALIHEPKILFLDEPTTGLDPAARLEIWETIQELKQRTTVILTTHYMEEADRLSDRIMILNHGEVVMTGTADELKQRISPPDTYELLLNTPTASDYQQKLASWINSTEVPNRHMLRFRLNHPDLLTTIIAQITPSDLRSIGLAQADLETVYLSVAGQPVPFSGLQEPVAAESREAGV